MPTAKYLEKVIKSGDEFGYVSLKEATEPLMAVKRPKPERRQLAEMR